MPLSCAAGRGSRRRHVHTPSPTPTIFSIRPLQSMFTCMHTLRGLFTIYLRTSRNGLNRILSWYNLRKSITVKVGRFTRVKYCCVLSCETSYPVARGKRLIGRRVLPRHDRRFASPLLVGLKVCGNVKQRSNGAIRRARPSWQAWRRRCDMLTYGHLLQKLCGKLLRRCLGDFRHVNLAILFLLNM